MDTAKLYELGRNVNRGFERRRLYRTWFGALCVLASLRENKSWR